MSELARTSPASFVRAVFGLVRFSDGRDPVPERARRARMVRRRPDVAAHRTAWHPPFAALLIERAPPNVDVEAEVVLTLEPQKADLLIIHRHGARLDEARVMRRL